MTIKANLCVFLPVRVMAVSGPYRWGHWDRGDRDRGELLVDNGDVDRGGLVGWYRYWSGDGLL